MSNESKHVFFLYSFFLCLMQWTNVACLLAKLLYYVCVSQYFVCVNVSTFVIISLSQMKRNCVSWKGNEVVGFVVFSH